MEKRNRISTQWLLLAILIFAGACTSQSENVVSPAKFSELMMEDNVLIVDVRTPEEYKSDRIEGAININIFDKDFKSRIEALDTAKTILVYCRSGRRSGKASKAFTKSGFSTIYDLKGGMVAWYSANMPVQR